jgi:membrane protein YqaA with SNARE-associated domain
VIESLRTTLGLYGATLVIAFIAGMFPIVSIELFLAGATALGVELRIVVVLIAIAVVGHQIAKTITYYAGAGAFELPRGKLRARIDALQARIDRWNKRPRLVMFLGATTGLPPLLLLGYIARPMMKMPITTFTAISVFGRAMRYATLVAVAALV